MKVQIRDWRMLRDITFVFGLISLPGGICNASYDGHTRFKLDYCASCGLDYCSNTFSFNGR